MFELTNEQRKCFGLGMVEESWTRMELKPSPYDQHTTITYLDGRMLRKFIETGDDRYIEYEVCEQLSEDGKYLLPKTAKGKLVLLSAAAVQKRTGLGMCLSYFRHRQGHSSIALYSHTSQKNYYTSEYEEMAGIHGMEDFRQWVEAWCRETSQEDLADIAAFAVQQRQHIRFREGDVFRFRINRRLYGYGRILLDYARMRKKKEPFWDILMGKPLVCSVYHIATERKEVSVEELKHLKSLPSVLMMDNRLFYGDFEIIGNLPVMDEEDYPIMYGDSISAGERSVILQCGKIYRRMDGAQALFRDFTNNSIGFGPGFSLPVLRQCIEAGSNAPYWEQDNWKVNRDLRNPKFRRELEAVCRQFDLLPSQLILLGQ